MGLLLLLLTARQGLTAVDRDDDDLSAVVAAPREESCCCNAPEEKAPMIDEWEGDVASSLHGVRRIHDSFDMPSEVPVVGVPTGVTS